MDSDLNKQDDDELRLLNQGKASLGKTYWQIVPYVTTDENDPPTEAFSDLGAHDESGRPDGWMGVPIRVGTASFIHDVNTARIPFVTQFIYPRSDDWMNLAEQQPRCDIFIGV